MFCAHGLSALLTFALRCLWFLFMSFGGGSFRNTLHVIHLYGRVHFCLLPGSLSPARLPPAEWERVVRLGFSSHVGG